MRFVTSNCNRMSLLLTCFVRLVWSHTTTLYQFRFIISGGSEVYTQCYCIQTADIFLPHFLLNRHKWLYLMRNSPLIIVLLLLIFIFYRANLYNIIFFIITFSIFGCISIFVIGLIIFLFFSSQYIVNQMCTNNGGVKRKMPKQVQVIRFSL